MGVQGLRFNTGKTRYDLIPAYAQEQYARVLTLGAEKYEERNWEKGMKWSAVLASLERHLAAVKRGEDFDKESGLLHSAHIMCNAAFLTEYYKIYPQGDDRPHKYLKPIRIGLDVDEVLCDFVGGFKKRFGKDIPDRFATFWNDPHVKKFYGEIEHEEEFWLGLAPRVSPDDLPFEPYCYITSRSVNSGITTKWLHNNGFPDVPVYTVGKDMSKVDIALQQELDIFVDDRFENFVELNNAGICCFLMDAPHNIRYDVGYKRVTSLKQLL